MMSSGVLIAEAISVAFMIVYPIVVAVLVHRGARADDPHQRRRPEPHEPEHAAAPPAHARAARQLAAFNAQPVWIPLLAAWERLWTLPVQVALSVVVLQVFRRGSLRWLWLAILAHALVDFSALALGLVTVIPGLTRTLLIEGVVAIFGIAGLLVIVKFRERQVSPPSEL